MTADQAKHGVLILNLGTPDNPEPEAVGKYLREFLMDGRVIDIPWIARWPLVNVLIVPKRKFASSEAYHKIWTKRGSPLSFHLEDLHRKVTTEFPSGEYQVERAMRYGNPTVESALTKLSGSSSITVFALYPQFAESSFLSSQEHVARVAKRMGLTQPIRFVPPFYERPEFIGAYARKIAAKLEPNDHLLLSFHGIPERHVRHTDRSGGNHCLQSPNCCDKIVEANRNCYRAQCFATARAIAAELKLPTDRYTVSFQSRLGRSPWIKPYTDILLEEFPKRGIKNLLVATPAFAADCLETIEEIGIRAKESFEAAGGEGFDRVECLNSDDDWAKGVAQMIRATPT